MPAEAIQPATVPEQLERQLRETQAALEQARAELQQRERLALAGQIAMGIGHELREPLSVISNLVYCLRLACGEREAAPGTAITLQRYLDCIEEQVLEADRVITGLLEYARTYEVRRQAVDLNGVVEGRAGTLRLPDNIRLAKQLTPGLPAALADPLHVERVLHNLTVNAIESMRADGGELRLATFSTGEAVVLEVADTGPGVPPELADKVFDPVFSTRPAGMGLGLALCRQLVEANQGSIGFRSAPGCGAAFQVSFSLAAG
jgi:signal transduction histidine kinase